MGYDTGRIDNGDWYVSCPRILHATKSPAKT